MTRRSGAAEGAFWGIADADSALARYRALVNTIDAGIYQLDESGHFVAVNDVAVETTGYGRDELLGEHVSLVLDDEDVAAIERELAGYVSSGNDVATFELAIDTVDGRAVPCKLRINPLVDGDEFRGTIGVVRELTETNRRVRTLESVRTADESIAGVADEDDIGVVVLDETSEVAWIDETIETALGVEREAVVGRNYRAVIEDTFAEKFADPESFVESSLALDDGDVESVECRVSGTDGDDLEGRWLEHRIKPIESGEYAGGRIDLYDDVTDRKRSEGALRESREAFQSLVDAVEEYAIFRLDADGRVISWNEGARQIKGYDREEILGEHLSTFYTEADRAAGVPDRNLERAIENGSIEDEGWRIRKDGTRFWANVTITPVRDADGDPLGYLKVTRDMTDRREREQELESELQRILSRISDAFYAVDDEFRFTHVNERAEELLDRSEEELLGECLWDVFPSAAEIDDVWDAFHTARETQEATSYELYYDTLGFWVEANLYPSQTGISVYFRDVTERIERQQALEKSEQRYRALAEHFPNGIVTLFDHDLEYTLAAGRGFERIPAEPADLEGRSFHDVWPDEVSDTLEPAFRAALEGEERSVELSYAGREWAIYAVPITDDRGDVFAGVTMAHDITERKESQRRLEATIEKLEESNERLEQFAYAASHDLQEPLRMVSSYLSLIERRYGDALDEDGEEFLAFAVDGAERMRDMIDGLLTYSRIETHGEPLESIDLDAVLEDVLEDLQLQLEEADAEVTADRLPHVEGDGSQLRQVFQNLLSNAIEYSGDDPPRIHVSAERRDARSAADPSETATGPSETATDRSGTTAETDAGEWIVSIRDEGVGIHPDDQDGVFEVFQRLHSHEDHPGTGIGLALCERIVERHGGDIWVDSEPDEGATFSFTLPPAEPREE